MGAIPDRLVYATEPAWHGVGVRLDPEAGFDRWAEEAGFNFRLLEAQPQFVTAAGAVGKVEDRKILYRSDTGEALSVVSDRYKVVQPREVLEFFRDLAESSGLRLEVAGTLFNGRRYWAQARLQGDLSLLHPEDRHYAFLLLLSSCDGTTATVGKFGFTRAVCENTIVSAMAEDGKEHRIVHLRDFDPHEMNEKLGISMRERFASTMEVLRKLADVKMNPAEMIKASIRILAPDQKDPEKLPKKDLLAKQIQLATRHEMTGSEFLPKGTALAWLQSLTEACDHESRARSPDRALQKKFFGSLMRAKRDGLELVSSPDLRAQLRGPIFGIEDRTLEKMFV
jgi:phage/plasmid-like protein (TIGR03299 family)